MRVVYRNYRTPVGVLGKDPFKTRARNSKKKVQVAELVKVVNSVKSVRKIQAKKEGVITLVT